MSAPGPAGPETPAEKAARRARSFGTVAAAYHGARTTYGPESLAWALSPAGTGPLDVLDLAAGTGLLTAALLARRPPPRLRAVEPDPGMRAEYARHAPGVGIEAGTAEAIPLPDASMDAVVVGTAFHWFDAGRALPEIARVLRDGGVLAALWTGPDDSVDWVREYRSAARAAITGDDDPLRARHVRGLGTDPLFDDSEERVFRHDEVRTLHELVSAAATYSEVLTAPAGERAAALAVTDRLLHAHLAAVGPAIPSDPESLAIPVAVRVVRARRRPRAGDRPAPAA